MRKINLFWFLTLWLDGSAGVPAVPATILKSERLNLFLYFKMFQFFTKDGSQYFKSSIQLKLKL